MAALACHEGDELKEGFMSGMHRDLAIYLPAMENQLAILDSLYEDYGLESDEVVWDAHEHSQITGRTHSLAAMTLWLCVRAWLRDADAAKVRFGLWAKQALWQHSTPTASISAKKVQPSTFSVRDQKLHFRACEGFFSGNKLVLLGSRWKQSVLWHLMTGFPRLCQNIIFLKKEFTCRVLCINTHLW